MKQKQIEQRPVKHTHTHTKDERQTFRRLACVFSICRPAAVLGYWW